MAWGLPGIHRASPGKEPTILSPASSPTPPGEGRQSSPGGGGSEPAEQQPAAAGRIGERSHPPAPGLQAAGLPHHRLGLNCLPSLTLAVDLLRTAQVLQGTGVTLDPGPPSGTLPAQRRVLALPPLPSPVFGGEVSPTPFLFVNIL